jgi:hypothetical protein
VCFPEFISSSGPAEVIHGIEITLAQSLDVFNLLTQTYPRYVDSGSRDAVEQTLVELLKQDALRVGLPASLDGSQRGVFHHVVAWLANQVGAVRRGLSRSIFDLLLARIHADPHSLCCSSYASADIFVLLSWSCTLYRVGVEGNPLLLTTRSCHPLLESWATLLDLILQVSSRSKTSLKKSAFVRTRRAFRSVGPFRSCKFVGFGPHWSWNRRQRCCLMSSRRSCPKHPRARRRLLLYHCWVWPSTSRSD